MVKDQVFRFSGTVCDWASSDQQEAKKILGGKGAGLIMMAKSGMPVPPGFTITTTVCNLISDLKDQSLQEKHDQKFEELMHVVGNMDTWLAGEFGYHPLVSVRSGAPISMPGMMDTILNVGLTPGTLPVWEERLGARAAWDSYRRLIQMLGATAYGVPMKYFDNALSNMKQNLKVEQDTDLTTSNLKKLVEAYLSTFEEVTGIEFPQTREEQMKAAIKAVFDSWMNPRAVEYRKLNNISSAMGTAVNIQAMVFGNMGNDSGTGVLFTRNPSTGENKIMGEFLQNAQGEDVVAGIRTPEPFEKMKELPSPWPSIYEEIEDMCQDLEEHYLDMVDIEFTVQKGELFILQSRTGKRSAAAAFAIAVDLTNDGTIDRETALSRLTPEQYRVVKRPMLDPSFKADPHKTGLPACPGIVTGRPVYSAQDAINCTVPCILVTHETTPDDIAGMDAAIGILTQTGGATSHAAVVARAMDKCCVVGTTSLDIEAMQKAGIEKVTIDGSTGKVWFDTEVPVVDSSQNPSVATVSKWCFEEMGLVHAVPLPDEELTGDQCVQVAHWWGYTEIIEALMHDLADIGSENIIIDTRSPADLMEDADAALVNSFGVNPYAGEFKDHLLSALYENRNVLPGLRIIGLSAKEAAAMSMGGFTPVGVEVAPKAVPTDYAVFARLGVSA